MSKRNGLIVALTAMVATLLSFFVLLTPIPSASDTGFSAVAAASYISEISKEPHATSDEDAHERVRMYLKDTLSEFIGAGNVTEMNYAKEVVGDGCEYDIKNLLGVIQGSSDTGIMLVAHYDSRGHIGRAGELGRSYGAADDGYGLATMLEIARLYGNKTLTNSIYLLFTDGEETGLYGARMAATETTLMDKIGFVINIEARGIQGAAYMFETSVKNDKVIDFYRHADLPVSYSLATAVYTVMPNMTDFTEFLAIGKAGVNFAVLDGLYYYHTPLDKFDNINLSSIQHYGEQIVPLVEEFVNNAKYSSTDYFTGTSDHVFFTLFPNVFINYSETFAIILNFVILAALVGLIVMLAITKKVAILGILKQIGYVFGALTITALFGLFVSRFIAFVGRVPWSLTYVRMQGTELPTLLIMGLVTLGVWFALKKWHGTPAKKTELLIAGTSVNLLLAIVTGFVLSGASFLFMIPALLSVIALWVRTLCQKRFVKHIAFGFVTFLSILLALPILYSLFLALTVGGLLALLVILMLFLAVVIPSAQLQLAIE
ncbi:MAG TPA: M28 family peptidase [Bacilli bacterium]|nr:M28 family peptidase [Bacilli bacterium]